MSLFSYLRGTFIGLAAFAALATIWGLCVAHAFANLPFGLFVAVMAPWSVVGVGFAILSVVIGQAAVGEDAK